MHIVKRAFWTAFWVETEVRRVDFGENSIFWAGADTGQDASGVNRDVRFINTQKRDTYLLGLIQTENTRPMVYRNEDTGWGWPPYFKLDSSNLQTDVADLKSTSSEPQWAVLTHYGWRNELLSTFDLPECCRCAPYRGPDAASYSLVQRGYFDHLGRADAGVLPADAVVSP